MNAQLVVVVVDPRHLVRQALMHALATSRVIALGSSDDLGSLDVAPDVIITRRRDATKARQVCAIVLELADEHDLIDSPPAFRLDDLRTVQSADEWSAIAGRARRIHQGGPNLTPRQAEVLRHVREGRIAKDIAQMMGVSVKTVENHKVALYAKLGVQSQAEVAARTPRTALDRLSER